MDERIKWIDYKGKKILVVDYRGLNTEKGIVTHRKAVKMVEEAKEKVLILEDVRNFVMTSDLIKESKLNAQRLKNKIDKQAVVGVSGAKKVLLISLKFFTGSIIAPFDTEEQAKEYLIS